MKMFTLSLGLLLLTLVQGTPIQSYPSLDDIDRSDIREIVESRGFICETHKIVTSDGYILGNYRIVNPLASKYFQSPLKPVIIQSGFLGSGVDFLIHSPNGFLDEKILSHHADLDSVNFTTDGTNLGFILANLGYDVWLTNPRGNYYSSNHTKLDTIQDKRQFWSFSLDEMALIDLPEMIDYILGITGTKTVGYVGFSRATLLMFALLSERPEYNQKISPYIAIAPPVYLSNIKSPLKFLSQTNFVLNFIRDHPGPCFARAITELTGICSNILLRPICNQIKMNLLSIDPNTTNATRIDIYLAHLPCGSSCWDFVHFAQRITSDHFKRIDFGPDFNLRKYGSLDPPEYNLKNVDNMDIAIFQSIGDETATTPDVGRLIEELEVPLIDKVTIEDPLFSHLDFLFDRNIGDLVNKRIAQLLARYRSK